MRKKGRVSMRNEDAFRTQGQKKKGAGSRQRGKDRTARRDLSGRNGILQATPKTMAEWGRANRSKEKEIGQEGRVLGGVLRRKDIRA